ncbi:MAG: hypothetical protein GW936_07535 [Gallionella sp.]|nr:hypothetical protein [Gallionella sp.]NCP80171.1 hypothetical protein [Gallionella sp.]
MRLFRFPPAAGYTIRGDPLFKIAARVKQYKVPVLLHPPTACPVKALLTAV